MTWCEHCRDHFNEDHYDEDDRHKVDVGPYGRLIGECARYKAALERIVTGEFDDLDPDDGLHGTSARAVAREALRGRTA